jgi:NitT/TauT family transport system permease protein
MVARTATATSPVAVTTVGAASIAAWRRRVVHSIVKSLIAVAGVAAMVVVVWEFAKWVSNTDDQLMPHIWTVAASFGDTNSQGTREWIYLLDNAGVTLRNSLFGFAIGAALGLFSGVVIARNKIIGAGVLPLTVLAQTVPIVAIAPALVLWLGTGLLAKVLIAAYLTFFPVTVATARGISNVAADQLDLMRICAFSEAKMLTKLQLPASMPLIFVGLETAAGLSVIGAIVGELPFGSSSGLGVVILTSWQFYTIQAEPLYDAAFASCLLGAALVFGVRAIRALVPAAKSDMEVSM